MDDNVDEMPREEVPSRASSSFGPLKLMLHSVDLRCSERNNAKAGVRTRPDRWPPVLLVERGPRADALFPLPFIVLLSPPWPSLLPLRLLPLLCGARGASPLFNEVLHEEVPTSSPFLVEDFFFSLSFDFSVFLDASFFEPSPPPPSPSPLLPFRFFCISFCFFLLPSRIEVAMLTEERDTSSRVGDSGGGRPSRCCGRFLRGEGSLMRSPNDSPIFFFDGAGDVFSDVVVRAGRSPPPPPGHDTLSLLAQRLLLVLALVRLLLLFLSLLELLRPALSFSFGEPKCASSSSSSFFPIFILVLDSFASGNFICDMFDWERREEEVVVVVVGGTDTAGAAWRGMRGES